VTHKPLYVSRDGGKTWNIVPTEGPLLVHELQSAHVEQVSVRADGKVNLLGVKFTTKEKTHGVEIVQ